MALDFSEFFKRYEAVVAQVDNVFQQVAAQAGDMVRCKQGCSDCCHALFDIGLVEALYLNRAFNKRLRGRDRNDVLERANSADRQIAVLKRKLGKASRQGRPSEEILEEVARVRVRCPLLGDDGRCAMYDARPITCRLYGIPTSIGGEAHSCHHSGFTPGGSYPTVHLDRIQEALFNISRDLVASLDTNHRAMGDLLLPPSMALITDMDEAWLGIRIEDEGDKAEAAKPEPAPAPEPLLKRVETGDADACAGCTEDKSACASCSENSFSITFAGHEKDGED